MKEGTKFCPHCGQMTPAVPAAAAHDAAAGLPCPQCQTQLKPGAKFCNHCGATVAAVATASAASAAQAPTPDTPDTPNTTDSVASSASVEPDSAIKQPLPPLFPAEQATRMGNNLVLWIGLAIALFGAITIAVYFVMGNSGPAPQKIGPMELPTPPVVEQAPPPAAESLPEAQQPQMVPSVPLPGEPAEAAADAAAAPAAVEAAPARPAPQPKPVTRPVPKPAPEPQPQPQAPAAPAPVPEEAAVKTCAQAGLLMRPVCALEGPRTFWKCAPNGKHWDNNIPGCRRSEEN
ncbi:MAG: zinc ribbon domain-containing protein [Comamonas sp.]|nr:zinc ribbon domain-containing protein [Comamonas sp.]